MRLEKYIRNVRYRKQEAAQKRRAVYNGIINGPGMVTSGNFNKISMIDLELLLCLYDKYFFENLLISTLKKNNYSVRLRMSRNMTRSAGSTRYRKALKGNVLRAVSVFVLSFSADLLGQTFSDLKRPVTVNGIECRDRLEALQCVFEHELIHLIELFLWDDSSCRRSRFRRLAGNFFCHKETTHNLITQIERAVALYDVQPGDMVEFDYRGKKLTGRINRITKRATVLCEHPDGDKYTDGKRYLKYYIPLSFLRKSPSVNRN